MCILGGMDNKKLSKNFTIQEFECKCGCGANDISMDLVDRLQELRDAVGMPLSVTSGVRCADWNREMGGSEASSHITGNSTAVDIACTSSRNRYIILEKAVLIFDRVGIAKNFIHCDVDPNKTAGVVWVY